MNKTEAEKKIAEIHEVFYSGHRLIGSPKGLMLTGAAGILLAGVHWIARLWEAGRIGTATYGTGTLALFVGLFLLSFGGKRINRSEAAAVNAQRCQIHPCLNKASGSPMRYFLPGWV